MMGNEERNVSDPFGNPFDTFGSEINAIGIAALPCAANRGEFTWAD